MVIFAPQNLVMHPPFTKLDFVTCRNLLIYLDAELQKKLMPLFHYSLNPGGILLLGSAETIGTATDLFTPLEGKLRIYRRLDTSRQANLSRIPIRVCTQPSGPRSPHPLRRRASAAPNLQILADQLAPAALFSGGGARHERRRYSVCQRENGQIPRAGGGQSQLEPLRHGA